MTIVAIERKKLVQVREALEKSADNFPANVQHTQALATIKEALAQPEQERGDSVCKEDDGCPTERAVLQSFWRETQTDIREMREDALSQYVEGRSTEYWKGYGKACQDILNNIKEKNT